MSMILTMTSAAIIAALSLSEVTVASLVACNGSRQQTEELETVFTDMDILEKTLVEMDCHVKKLSENELAVETVCGTLRYRRNHAGEPFRMALDDIRDAQGLLENIREFETTYGRNVQDYTYHHIKENLADGMSIENEFFEGDDLYLTINVE